MQLYPQHPNVDACRCSQALDCAYGMCNRNAGSIKHILSTLTVYSLASFNAKAMIENGNNHEPGHPMHSLEIKYIIILEQRCWVMELKYTEDEIYTICKCKKGNYV